jgi:hypothetical protein
MDMDTLIKNATILTVSIVAGIAAWISYTHIYVVGGHNPLLPIAVDGMLVTSSLVLLTAHRSKLSKTLWIARFTLWLGIAATLFANVYFGRSGGVLGSAVSAWPAVCLIFTVETIMQLAKAQRLKRRAAVPSGMLVQATHKPAEAVTVPTAPNRTGPKPKPVQTGSEPATGKVPSIRKIRDQLGCGQPVATQVQAVMREQGVTVAKAFQIRERVKVDARKR